MSDHSPEPWKHESEDDGCGFLEVVDANGMMVCLGEGVLSDEDAERIVACVNACAGIPTEWLHKYGRTAFVRKIVLVPDDTVGVVHEMLSKPLELSEKVVALRTCDECGGLTTTTEADYE